jgi:hypothetical protein
MAVANRSSHCSWDRIWLITTCTMISVIRKTALPFTINYEHFDASLSSSFDGRSVRVGVGFIHLLRQLDVNIVHVDVP